MESNKRNIDKLNWIDWLVGGVVFILCGIILRINIWKVTDWYNTPAFLLLNLGIMGFIMVGILFLLISGLKLKKEGKNGKKQT